LQGGDVHNTDSLNRLLERRRQDADWGDDLEAIAALAMTLAEALDLGAGSGLAAVAREYRTTVERLSTQEGAVTDAFDQLAAQLSAKVDDTAH
jgi:hypothetical protein